MRGRAFVEDCVFPRVALVSSFTADSGLSSSPASAAVELNSINGAHLFLEINGNFQALLHPFFFFFFFFFNLFRFSDWSPLSLELVVSTITALCFVFVSTFSCYFSLAAATSLFAYTLGAMVASGIMFLVWADSLTILPGFFLILPSSFEPRAHSFTSTVESSSSCMSDGLKSKLVCCSEISNSHLT